MQIGFGRFAAAMITLALMAVRPHASPAAESLEVTALAPGLDKSLAAPVEKQLQSRVEDVLGDKVNPPDAGQKAANRLTVRFDGKASASAPYATTASGEIVKMQGARVVERTGKAGLEHTYSSRFTFTGRLVFTLEKFDGKIYKKVDSWSQSLLPVEEERSIAHSSVIEQNGNVNAMKANADAYREATAKEFTDWLPRELSRRAEEGLKICLVQCEVVKGATDGRRASVRVKVTNKSPWGIDQVTVDVTAQGTDVGGPSNAHVTDITTGPIKPGESVTFDRDVKMGFFGERFQVKGYSTTLSKLKWKKD